ncbi:MAG: hypothetical protein ABH814_03355 [bacterium]
MLSCLWCLLDEVTKAYEPVIPETAKKARAILDSLEPEILLEKLD